MAYVLDIETAMERKNFKVPVDADKEKLEYEQSMEGCENPPPCVACKAAYFAFCSNTGYCCHEYYKYTADRSAESGVHSE